jgi:hypothetical protein
MLLISSIFYLQMVIDSGEGKGTFRTTENVSHAVRAVTAEQRRILAHFRSPVMDRPNRMDIRMKVEGRNPIIFTRYP